MVISGFASVDRNLPASFALRLGAKYHAAPQAIVDYTYIRYPDRLPVGQQLVLPNAKGPDFEKPAPPPVIRPSYAAPRTASPSVVSAGGPGAGSNTGNRFAYGYCTWYVGTPIPVPRLRS